MKRSSGYSTEKRTQILEYLVEHKDEDVSVKDIEKYLTTKELSVNVTTIYRYLDKLCGEGTVMKRIDEKSGKSTYHYAKPNHTCHNHIHMKCSGCGKIYHMDCGFMDEFKKHIFEHHEFMLDCKTSMLHGFCNKCSKTVII